MLMEVSERALVMNPVFAMGEVKSVSYRDSKEIRRIVKEILHQNSPITAHSNLDHQTSIILQQLARRVISGSTDYISMCLLAQDEGMTSAKLTSSD